MSTDAPTRVSDADGTAARAHFTSGRNCAESVLSSLRDAGWDVPVEAGAGLRQGLGGSGCVCGALMGGTIAISSALHAQDPNISPAESDEIVRRYRDTFVERWGSTCCRVLKRGQQEGSDEWMAHCAEITEFAGSLAAELVRDRASSTRRDWRAAANNARRALLDALSGAAVGVLATAIGGAAGERMAVALLAGALVGAGAGAAIEFASPRISRAGRALRATGAVAAAVLALMPQAASRLLATLGGGGTLGTAATLAVALPALALAVWSAWDFKRYR